MSTETEVKYFVHDLVAVRSRLEKLGARLLQPRVRETNLRFDLPDNSLRRQSRVLRLRQDTAARLTYKGPSENFAGVRSRTEIEVEVADLETTRYLLEALGYQIVATYEKYRQIYRLELANNHLHVFLDELPYGDFVEIEGETVDVILVASRQLGLDPQAAIPASYLALFETLCTERGYDPTRLTFAALAEFNPDAESLHVKAADS